MCLCTFTVRTDHVLTDMSHGVEFLLTNLAGKFLLGKAMDNLNMLVEGPQLLKGLTTWHTLRHKTQRHTVIQYKNNIFSGISTLRPLSESQWPSKDEWSLPLLVRTDPSLCTSYFKSDLRCMLQLSIYWRIISVGWYWTFNCMLVLSVFTFGTENTNHLITLLNVIISKLIFK